MEEVRGVSIRSSTPPSSLRGCWLVVSFTAQNDSVVSRYSVGRGGWGWSGVGERCLWPRHDCHREREHEVCGRENRQENEVARRAGGAQGERACVLVAPLPENTQPCALHYFRRDTKLPWSSAWRFPGNQTRSRPPVLFEVASTPGLDYLSDGRRATP